MASSESDSGSGFRYPYPSTLNPATLISIKLSGTHDYPLWETQMLCLVESQELVGFIDGTILPPPETIDGGEAAAGGTVVVVANEEYRLWKRSDRLVKSWILSSLKENVLATVVGLSTAKSVWTTLDSTFGHNLQEKMMMKKKKKEEDEEDEEEIDQKMTKIRVKKKKIMMMKKKKEEEEEEEIEKSIGKYMPLYEATIAGDWEATKSILDGDKEAATAIITENGFTLLHAAVVTGKHIDFVEKLVEYLPMEALFVKNKVGSTALIVAAVVGNTEAAKILMKKNPALLSVRNAYGNRPLQVAIMYEHRDTYLYFKELCNDDHYFGENASEVLGSMVVAENFDIALDFVKRYPHAAKLGVGYESPLNWMAEMPSCFRSGISLNFLESFVYSCVPVHVHHSSHFLGGNGDVENPSNNTQTLLHHGVHFLGVLCNRLKLMLWDAILLVPSIKIIRQKKLVHHQAVQLVKFLCEAIKSSNDEASVHSPLSKALTTAARHGTLEVVEEILRTFPSTIWSRDGSKHNITEIAVINRCEKVFNISYHMKELQEYLKFYIDINGNSILHLAGRMVPRHKLNLVSGAALQMQRELQWYKEVEKLSNPYLKICHNYSKETPAMVFTREHKELVVEGEKWMKDTANSCSIAAALIITVVFAAAITVPGGNKDNGPPVFNNPAFLIFAFSDTVALFMSTTSLLMFLSILTARYAEEDFLHTLPKRLVFGLLTLFLSITSMVLAFSTAVYLLFDGRNEWVIILLVALSSLPVTSFVTLQFPLLIDVYSSTYGRGIFGEQSDRQFHRHIKGFLQYIVKCFASTQKYISHFLSSSS